MASITFDHWKILDLDADIVDMKSDARSRIEEIIPDIKPHSKKNVVESMQKHFGITINDAKIQTLNELLPQLPEEEDAWQVVFGLCEYLRLHYLQKNYLTCILTRGVASVEEDRRLITLELIEDDRGIFWLPNKQKLFHAPPLWDCVVSTDPHLTREIALAKHWEKE